MSRYEVKPIEFTDLKTVDVKPSEAATALADGDVDGASARAQLQSGGKGLEKHDQKISSPAQDLRSCEQHATTEEIAEQVTEATHVAHVEGSVQ